MPQASFVAQTASWLPGHLGATIEAGWRHRGLSFIRILQHCPVFSPDAFASSKPAVPRDPQAPPDSEDRSPSLLFLEHEDGIAVGPNLERIVALHGERRAHDPRDRTTAVDIAAFGRSVADPTLRLDPMGLLYRNPDTPCYNDLIEGAVSPRSTDEKIRALEAELDKFTLATE